jgi:hypothetical protein
MTMLPQCYRIVKQGVLMVKVCYVARNYVAGVLRKFRIVVSFLSSVAGHTAGPAMGSGA